MFNKKNNSKGFFVSSVSGLISLLLVMSSFSGCVGEKLIGNFIPTTSFSNSSDDNDAVDSTVEDQSTTNTSESVIENSDEIIELVNDDIYNIVLQARDNFSTLLDHGDSVSEKLINSGIGLNINDSGYIDSNLQALYENICQYISCYNEKKFDACYRYATSIIGFCSVFSQEYLYGMLVSSHLEGKYQSGIKRDEFGNVVFKYGNICLENGKLIRFIGGVDEIVGDEIDNGNISKLKWIASVPRLLFNQYSQFQNSVEDDICYIMNETKLSSLCDLEIANIIAEGAEMYDFNPTNVTIKSIDNGLVFVDSDDNTCGILNFSQSIRYNNVFFIRNGIDNKEGEALILDSFASDICKKDANYTYNK